MRFDTFDHVLRRIPLPVRISVYAVSWLVAISILHYTMNLDHGERRIVRMGYMPVITNLASPLLDYASKHSEGVRFQAIKFASFAEMAEALRNERIQAAFMIAPLAIVLRQQGENVKVVYIGNRHESTLVARKELKANSVSDLAGKTVAVPMRYSGHNLSILDLMKKLGLSGRIKVVEMNPPDMASALTVGSLDAYYVGEPFAAQTIKNGDARVVHYVEDVWKHFICNLLLVKENLIENDPELVRLLVQSAARSGIWAEKNQKQAAEIAAEYWNQPVDLVEYALTTPKDRTVFDEFVPKEAEMKKMAQIMVEFGLSKHSRIDGLVDDRFAASVNMDGITTVESILAVGNE